MKIFVTGGCGFIGSNFILQNINKPNCEFFNFDKLTYSGSLENLTKIQKNNNYTFFNGDICDQKAVINALNIFKPSHIVHFAAESHVDRSIDSPLQFINTNVLGTAVLLDSATKYWFKNNRFDFKFLHISTDEVFGSLSAKGKFSEESSYSPNSPYSASKAGSDHLVRAWHQTYSLPILITNCSNNYGPFQFPEKLIPLTIANCLDEKNIPVYGNGKNIRDWIFVEDHCDALFKILNYGIIGDTYTIGGNNEISNIDIFSIICNLLNQLKPRTNGSSYNELISFVTDRPGHDFRYSVDITKICQAIDWLPRESFNSGIYKTVKWYIKNEAWWRFIQKKHYNQERLGLNHD